MATSIFGVYCVDAWLVYRRCSTYSLHPTPRLNQQEFYSTLVEELIDNHLYQIRMRRRARENTEVREKESVSTVHGFPQSYTTTTSDIK